MAEDQSANGASGAAPGRGGLLGDIARLYLWPEALFAELPQVNRAAGALWLLLGLHVLYGFLLLSTGVHDYDIERQTQREVAREAARQPGEENADQLARSLEAIEKKA